MGSVSKQEKLRNIEKASKLNRSIIRQNQLIQAIKLKDYINSIESLQLHMHNTATNVADLAVLASKVQKEIKLSSMSTDVCAILDKVDCEVLTLQNCLTTVNSAIQNPVKISKIVSLSSVIGPMSNILQKLEFCQELVLRMSLLHQLIN